MTVFTLGQATATALGKAGASLRAHGTAHDATGRTRTPHRTGAPVLRDSIEAGTFEELFFAVPAKGETDTLLRIARRTLDAGRQLRREARAGDRILTAAERRRARMSARAMPYASRVRPHPSAQHAPPCAARAPCLVQRRVGCGRATLLAYRLRLSSPHGGAGCTHAHAWTCTAD